MGDVLLIPVIKMMILYVHIKVLSSTPVMKHIPGDDYLRGIPNRKRAKRSSKKVLNEHKQQIMNSTKRRYTCCKILKKFGRELRKRCRRGSSVDEWWFSLKKLPVDSVNAVGKKRMKKLFESCTEEINKKLARKGWYVEIVVDFNYRSLYRSYSIKKYPVKVQVNAFSETDSESSSYQSYKYSTQPLRGFATPWFG